MIVRDYTPADREACLALFDSNVPAFFTAPEREDFAGFLDSLPGPYLVVEEEAGTVVACGGYAIKPGTRVADLCWGMVRRERHGTGLGRLLLHARLSQIQSRTAAETVELNTSQYTRGFYERAGFVTLRILRDGYAPRLHRCELRLEYSKGEAPGHPTLQCGHRR